MGSIRKISIDKEEGRANDRELSLISLERYASTAYKNCLRIGNSDPSKKETYHNRSKHRVRKKQYGKFEVKGKENFRSNDI